MIKSLSFPSFSGSIFPSLNTSKILCPLFFPGLHSLWEEICCHLSRFSLPFSFLSSEFIEAFLWRLLLNVCLFGFCLANLSCLFQVLWLLRVNFCFCFRVHLSPSASSKGYRKQEENSGNTPPGHSSSPEVSSWPTFSIFLWCFMYDSNIYIYNLYMIFCV